MDNTRVKLIWPGVAEQPPKPGIGTMFQASFKHDDPGQRHLFVSIWPSRDAGPMPPGPHRVYDAIILEGSYSGCRYSQSELHDIRPIKSVTIQVGETL